MSVVHLIEAAAAAGDARAIEALDKLRAYGAQGVDAKIEAALAPVIEAQTLLSENLRRVGELLFLGTTPPAEQPAPPTVAAPSGAPMPPPETPAETPETPETPAPPTVAAPSGAPMPPPETPTETPETPSPAADEEGAEENLDAARAAEAALPPDALPVGPGGEPPADQEEEDLPKTPSEDDLPPVPPAPEAPPDGDEQ